MVNPSGDSEPRSFMDDGEHYGLCIDRTWVDTHASLFHMDQGLYDSVCGIQDVDALDRNDPRMIQCSWSAGLFQSGSVTPSSRSCPQLLHTKDQSSQIRTSAG